MGVDTEIEWCDHTFNGVRGCSHALLPNGQERQGCANCYAEAGSKRNSRQLGTWGEEGTRVLSPPKYWEQLDKWHRAAVQDGELRRVFCYSIADVFESPRGLANLDVCSRGRGLLWQAIERLCPTRAASSTAEWPTPRGLIFLLLTKRPDNVPRMVPREWLTDWPPHVWIGTSVEDQESADWAIPHLLSVPGVPFLSIEPLLGPIRLPPNVVGRVRCAVDWLIVGGESGHGARPCDLDWISDLVQQAKAAHCPVFVKQLGSRPLVSCIDPGFHRQPCQEPICDGATPSVLPLRHKKGGDPDEWPADLRIRQIPKTGLAATKAGGR